MKAFELGRAYERKSHDAFFHIFLGYASILAGWGFFAFSVWDWNTRLTGLITLNIVGCISLWLGFEESKELTEIKK
jgi:hypothetical protein